MAVAWPQMPQARQVSQNETPSIGVSTWFICESRDSQRAVEITLFPAALSHAPFEQKCQDQVERWKIMVQSL